MPTKSTAPKRETKNVRKPRRSIAEPKLTRRQIEAVADYLAWWRALPPELKPAATWAAELRTLQLQ